MNSCICDDCFGQGVKQIYYHASTSQVTCRKCGGSGQCDQVTNYKYNKVGCEHGREDYTLCPHCLGFASAR